MADPSPRAAALPDATEAFRFFDLQVTAVRDITPSFRRVTLSGPDADLFADPGWDQRIKVVLPHPSLPFETMPRGVDWYLNWRDLPPGQRHDFRTYTTRAVRHAPSGSEIDIDMVRHSPVLGPASAWIEQVRIGQRILVLGPDATWRAGEPGGVDFVPPRRTDAHLLVGDETAAPAIAVMLEHLPHSARGIAVLELPDDGDHAYLPAHPGFEVRCFTRTGGERNRLLVSEALRAARELTPAGEAHAVEEIDVDHDILWEVPRTARGGAALRAATLYAWVAGEAAGVREVRRGLVGDLGVDRRAVAFMGYWRFGKAEGS